MKTLRMPKISKQRFNDFNAVSISLTTLLIALTTFLQLYASALTDQYRRIAQQHSVERTEVVLTGTIKYNYDYYATYKTWTETQLKQATAKVFDKNEEALRLQTLAKELEAQSPVFKAGYVEGTATPDWADYKATLYSYDATRLREMFLFEKKMESYANAIADELVLQITILAVGIAFFGLAVSMSVRTRNMFVVLGYVIVSLCTIWLVVSAYQLNARPTINMPAIQAFSRGEAARESGNYDEASFAYDTAIKEDPQYAHAYFKRSLMHFNLERIDSAVSDMLMAHRYGMADEGNAELGLMYYLNANFQEAIQHNQKFIDSTPDDISLLASQFLNYMLLGNYQKADETLSTLLALTDGLAKGANATQIELPTSFWLQFDSLATDLSRLDDLLNGGRHRVLFTPPRNKITIDPVPLSQYIRRTYTKLREKELEYSSGNPSEPTQFPLTVNAFVFGDFPRVGDDFRSLGASEQFQGDTNEIWVKYSIETKVQPVHSVTWRLYLNNNELFHLRTSYSEIELSSREYLEPFAYDENYMLNFPAGEYRVEMYVNGTLSQSGTFSIATQSE